MIQMVRILTLSDPIPNDLMSFGPDFPPDLQTPTSSAMKDFAADDADGFAAAFNAYSWTEVADTNDAEFDSIRTILEASATTSKTSKRHEARVTTGRDPGVPPRLASRSRRRSAASPQEGTRQPVSEDSGGHPAAGTLLAWRLATGD